ncbi:hypothetical protein [Glycomyces algeriensis]|uniref:DUF7144 domain-containing protein n=1 Tax=Glycomyces algeriensis TaxID=256037 RepID=A0A9W6G530_9ACTN|nr:hypothetical protein [Glycomyces algeriensis]MDA1367093.1 hypothetical protein [Glycomyces algeriensis]MDR7348520.1 hypothetical protein [Glycomyces algeriensis]GLI41224.1 hypothetical protein GALLR39Z86_10740 [Glycomyces algeriensis]
MTREDWLPRRSAGGSVLAGVLLLLMGAWQVAIGYAVAGGDVFVFTGGGYWYRGDNTGWGWVNLAIGLAAIVFGLGQLGVWRRFGSWGAHPVPAMVVAAVSAVNQVLLAPQYPLWTSIVIALDVFVIWGLATRTRTTT